MKYNNLLYFLLFAVLLTVYSCGTDDIEPEIMEPEVEMMDDDDDDNEGNNDGSNQGELEDAPSFSLKTTTDEAIESADFEDRNLVIFFFGFNCPPCRAVGPSIESKLHQKFKDKENFAIIGVDQWEGNDAGVDNFQSITGITFPLGVKGAETARNFGTTFDRLVVVNAEGKIVFKGNSIASNNLDEVVDIVSGLLE